MLVCLRLCRIYPLEKLESPLDEMREFALAGGALEKASLERLTAAMLREDDEQMPSLVKELRFERFCVQFCHWVCFLRCHLFCVCVCPPRTIGVFTKIGGLFYDTDVHSDVRGNGLTLGDERAFYSTLRLNGGLSVVDGAPLIEYRFETIATDATGAPTGSWTTVDAGQIAATNIGSFIRPIVGPPFVEVDPGVGQPPRRRASSTSRPTPTAGSRSRRCSRSPPMVPGSGWRFVPGSDLINLITPTLLPFTASVDETGVDAGESANAPAYRRPLRHPHADPRPGHAAATAPTPAPARTSRSTTPTTTTSPTTRTGPAACSGRATSSRSRRSGSPSWPARRARRWPTA